MAIKGFTGQYRFLSNFWPAEICWCGKIYPTVEHAYVASKTHDENMRDKIRLTTKPGDVKRLGKKLQLRDDWDLVKLAFMRNFVKQKFVNNTELSNLLLNTGDEHLEETNTWGDTYWGVYNGVGHNYLGKILMEIRDVLKRTQAAERAEGTDGVQQS